MTHNAIEAQLLIRLLLLADSMDEDRYPDADLIRSAAHRIEALTASERLYKDRAERAEAGWAELKRLLHANEVAFGADTNAAVDELNRMRAAIVGVIEAAQITHNYYTVKMTPAILEALVDLVDYSLCPEHGGPIDDCEQCRYEQETADDQVVDDDWPKIVEFDE